MWKWDEIAQSCKFGSTFVRTINKLFSKDKLIYGCFQYRMVLMEEIYIDIKISENDLAECKL